MSDPLAAAAPLGRAARSLVILLLGATFLDELASGVPGVGSPGVQEEFAVSYGRAAGWPLTAMLALSVLLEPPIFLLADRHPRKPFVCAGLALTGLVCLLAALAPGYPVFLAVLLLYGPASGAGVTLAQATLMDARPHERERLLARWALLGFLGDLTTPALFAALAVVALGWRTAFALCGLALLIYALSLARQPFPPRQTPAGERQPSLLAALRAALGRRRLLLWLLGAKLCSLLDEVFIAFGALWLRDHVGASVATRSLILSLFMVGGLAGLALADRLLARFSPRRLLGVAAAGAALAYFAWLAASQAMLSGLAMLAVGFFASAHYPIAKAQAYRAFPEGSGTVNAVAQLFAGLGVLAPLALAWTADRFGLGAALGLLALQPLGLLALALAPGGFSPPEPRP